MDQHSTIEAFFHQYPKRTFQKGDVLIHAGRMPAAYYIAEGIVSQYDISDAGDKLVVNVYKPGAFISLASILNELPADFFFEASTPLTVYKAPPHEVARFLKENPAVTYDALARISRGTSGLMLRLARVMEGNAEGRILQELAIMRQRFPTDTHQIIITKTELAAQTGLARETVSRALKRLMDQGVIRTARGVIEVL